MLCCEKITDIEPLARGLEMVVLGGRNHYCINPKLKKAIDKNDACQELLDAESCIYKHKVADLFEKMVRDKKGHHRIWDMEDLIRKGNTMSGKEPVGNNTEADKNNSDYYVLNLFFFGSMSIFCCKVAGSWCRAHFLPVQLPYRSE